MYMVQKVKIHPTKEQEEVLWILSEKCRMIYNFALSERIGAEAKNKKINYIKQQNDLPSIKEHYPEYKWVYSNVLQGTLRKLDTDYKSFRVLIKKDYNAKPPRFKGKKFFTTMCYNSSGFKFLDNKIRLSHKHPSGIPLIFDFPKKFMFDTVRQIELFKKKDSYFISITYIVDEPPFVDNGLVQAFDLGVLKHTAVNMEGKFVEFTNRRPDRYWKPKIEQIQSRGDHCKRYSLRWYKLNKNLRKMSSKSSNQMKDNLHKMSRKIVDNTKSNTIIVGDLSPMKMCQKNKHQKVLHASIHNTGIFGRFVGFLTYKSTLVGKRVIENSEYKTSQRCCCCGSMKKMPLSIRVYVCDNCGNEIDRDKNSAVNIMLDYLSQNGLWIAYWCFVNNLRQTGLTIVSHSQEAITKNGGLGYE